MYIYVSYLDVCMHIHVHVYMYLHEYATDAHILTVLRSKRRA